MKKAIHIICLLLGVSSFISCAHGGGGPHYIDIQSDTQLSDWFRYDPERNIVISGHRGGMTPGFPENCIQTFENVLGSVEAFFEIDPRLTKDSVIVLMHDRTLDRTTNGTGRVIDHTYEELLQLRLVDRQGNLTDFKIPTLEEAIEWSKGKTILNLDVKDVPLQMTADLLERMGAVNVMLTVHSGQQALYYYGRHPGSMFSAHIRNMDEYVDYQNTGIPWSQFMAYVGPAMRPELSQMYDMLRSSGVMCMISTAPTHDKLPTPQQRRQGYVEEIAKRPDVIETDYPAELMGLF